MSYIIEMVSSNIHSSSSWSNVISRHKEACGVVWDMMYRKIFLSVSFHMIYMNNQVVSQTLHFHIGTKCLKLAIQMLGIYLGGVCHTTLICGTNLFISSIDLNSLTSGELVSPSVVEGWWLVFIELIILSHSPILNSCLQVISSRVEKDSLWLMRSEELNGW